MSALLLASSWLASLITPYPDSGDLRGLHAGLRDHAALRALHLLPYIWLAALAAAMAVLYCLMLRFRVLFVPHLALARQRYHLNTHRSLLPRIVA